MESTRLSVTSSPLAKRMRVAGLLLSTLLISQLVGCSSESAVETGNRERVFYLGNGTEPQTIDPHVLSGSPEARIATALFEGLVRANPHTLAIEAGVAERWEYSPDGRSITFYINPNARFSNGEPITADDVVWSWHRALNPKTGNLLADYLFSVKNAEAYHRGRIDDPAEVGVYALDERTLRVELEFPDPYALRKFAYVYNTVVHPETILAHGEMTSRYSKWTRPENFVGSGPFVLDGWAMQRYLRVKRNEHYWDADRVALEGIVFRSIESDSTEEKMFRSGQLHATGSVPNTKIPTYRSYAESPLVEAPYMSTYYYMLNTRRPPLDNVKVRRALAMAIDRRQLTDSVLEGTVLPSSNYIPLGMPGYDYPQVLSFDPEAARQLLAEAGYPGGQGFPDVELIYNTSENHRTVAVAVQQMWKQYLNVNVQIANQEWKVYLDTLDREDYTIARMGWIGDVYPGSFLDRLVSDSGTNRVGFSNPDFDDIILNQVRASHDVAELMRLYREAERLLLEETPLIPIYSYKVKRLVQPGLRGLPANQTDTFNYKYVELAEQAAAWQPQASLE